MEGRELQLLQAAIKLWGSYKMSSSTLPPGAYGIGGQMLTGWVRGEQVEELFDVLETEYRDELRGYVEGRNERA